jgi:predicted transcriptional regulator
VTTAKLLGVSRAKVSKVMSEYTNHGKTASAKRNNVRKSTLTKIACIEKDCFEESHNSCSTGELQQS